MASDIIVLKRSEPYWKVIIGNEEMNYGTSYLYDTKDLALRKVQELAQQLQSGPEALA